VASPTILHRARARCTDVKFFTIRAYARAHTHDTESRRGGENSLLMPNGVLAVCLVSPVTLIARAEMQRKEHRMVATGESGSAGRSDPVGVRTSGRRRRRT
jgi:hypothetical protein